MRRNTVIFSNSLANASAQAVSFMTAFYLLPRIVHLAGQATFGLWATVAAILMVIGLADAATMTSVVRVVSRTPTGDRETLHPALHTTALLVGIAHLVLALLFLALSYVPAVVFSASAPGLASTGPALLRLGAYCVILTTSNPVAGGVLMGLQRFWLRALTQYTYCVVMIVGFIRFVMNGGDIITYGWVIVAATGIAAGVQLAAAIACMECLRRPVALSLTGAKEISRFGAILMINRVADYLMYTTDRLVLQHTCGSASVTTYHVANRCNDMGQAFLSFPLGALIPPLSAADASGDRDYTLRMVTVGSLVYAAFCVPVLCAWLSVMKPFLNLWMGDAIGEAAAPAAILFLSTIIVAAPFKVLSHALVAHGTMRPVAAVKCVYAVINVLASIYLASRIGMIGVVLPTVFYWWCVYPGTVLWMAHATRIAPFLTGLRLAIPMLCVLAVAAGLSPFLVPWDLHHGWLDFALRFLSLMLLYYAIFLLSAMLSNALSSRAALAYVRKVLGRKEFA